MLIAEQPTPRLKHGFLVVASSAVVSLRFSVLS
jgi:hypothetical protein